MRSIIDRNQIESIGVITFITAFIAVSRIPVIVDQHLLVLWITDLAWSFAALAAGLKCFSAAATMAGYQRQVWRLFGMGCFSWFAGMLVWDYKELIVGTLTPFPAISDIGFIAFAPLFLAGFVMLRSHSPGNSLTLIQVAKIGILICSIIIAHLIVLLEPVRHLNESALYVFAALAYPVVYMSTLVFAIATLWRYFEKGFPPGLLLLITGFAIHAIVDSFYAYELLGRHYEVGHYLDITWLVGFAFIYLGAAARQSSKKDESADVLSHPVGSFFGTDSLLPMVTIFFVILVAFSYQENLTSETLAALFPPALLLALFIGVNEYASQRIRIEMREHLAASEAQLVSVLETVPYGVQEIDIDGYINYSNPAHDKLLGYERESLFKQPISGLYADPEEGRATMEYLSYLVEEQPEPTSYFARLRKHDGSVMLIQIDWDYKRDAGGDIVGFISVMTDITEKRRLDNQLRQAAAVFENTSEAVVITDMNTNITAVNNAFCEIMGYTEAEVLGRQPSLWRSERHDSSFYKKMWASVNMHGNWRGEVWDRRKDGEIFPTWQSISAVRNDADEVTNYVSVFTDISSLKQTQEQLNYLAYHDPLTDMPNRLLFNDRLLHAMERAERTESQIALLFVDLDNFKNVNDSLGHLMGDELLVKAASRLRGLVRREDTVARLGGDEFIIIMENVPHIQDTAFLAQKLIEHFHEPFIVQGHELHVTLSIGISVYPRDGDDVQTLVKNADAALYRAKAEGRNDFYYYTEELTSSVFERLQIESALRNAVKNQELVLHYQPQFSLSTGGIVGVEALLRWNHPQLGLLPPARFIDLAEDTGLIVTMGEWVLSTACREMRSWLSRGYDFGRIAVNVSGLQLQRGDFQKMVNDVLINTQLDPERLELEITENFIMHKTEKAIAMLDNLKSIGIQIAIDDFGTGYSSLSYLKRLPIDKLKIDRSFVRDIPHDANDEAIACAIIAMSRALDLKVIAEGVEVEEQKEFLLSQGCDEAQGYLYSKPLPAADLLDFASVLKNL